MTALVVYFDVSEHADDEAVEAHSLDGSSTMIETGATPHFEIEVTVAGARSRKDALEAAATKILREIADYG